MMKYGERLRRAREHAGLTQEELEQRTNGVVKQGSISKIERGDQTRSAFDIDLAIALNIHPKWLKDEDQNFIPLWLDSEGVSEQKQEYSNKPLTQNELKAIHLLKKMTSFQIEEWLIIGEKMANEADRFRKALTPHFENGKMDD